MKSDYKLQITINIGAALEYFDFVVFIYLIPILNTLFFPESKNEYLVFIQTAMLFGTNVFAKIIGSLYFGLLSIKWGRMHVMLISINLMAISTLLIGLIPTYQNIGILAAILMLILRFMQGLAYSVEIPTTVSFFSQHFKNNLATKIAYLISSATLGSVLASFTMSVLYYFLSVETIKELAWRVPFIFGGTLGLIGSYLRRIYHSKTIGIEDGKISLNDFKINIVGIVQGLLLISFPALLVIIYLYLPHIFYKFYHIPLKLSYKASTIGLLFSFPSAFLCAKFIDQNKKIYIKILVLSFVLSFIPLWNLVSNYPEMIYIFTITYQFFLTSFMINALYKMRVLFTGAKQTLFNNITYNSAFLLCGIIQIFIVSMKTINILIFLPLILSILFFITNSWIDLSYKKVSTYGKNYTL